MGIGRNKAFLRTLVANLTPNREILVLGVKSQGERLKLAEDLKRHYGCKVEIKPFFSNEKRTEESYERKSRTFIYTGIYRIPTLFNSICNECNGDSG